MRILLIEILLISLIVSAFPASSPADETGWNEAGVRIGFMASSRVECFRQYEAYAAYGLPWDWRTSSGLGLTPQLSVSLGSLDGAGETGFIGSLGTALLLNKPGSGLAGDLGITINFLDRRQFGSFDFGSILQFGAYLGINYRFSNNFKIGYRLQHISNGHIIYAESTPNPGLDFHMFEASYTF